MHGLKDYGGHYDAFARRLVARGYAVYAFDLPGHGRSAGPRVSIRSFNEYVDDLSIYMKRVKARNPGKPVFLFGHSMGGTIVTLYTVTRHPDLAGLITSGPALELDVWPLTIALTIGTAALLPNAPALKLPNENFSSNPAVVRAMGKDPLIYQPPGPAKTAAELVGAIHTIWAHADQLVVPVLFLHGTADRLTAPSGSRDLYAVAPSTDKTLRIYPGFFHDLIHEPHGDEVQTDIMSWIDAHMGRGTAPTNSGPTPRRAHPPSTSLLMQAGYSRTVDSGRLGGLHQLAGVGVRARSTLGALPLCLGFDGGIGGGDTGVAYRADLYALGLAYPFGGGQFVTLCAGGGVSAAGDTVPFAWEIPVAASAEFQLGPIRALAAGRVSFVLGEDARTDGAGLPLGDELGVDLGVQLGRDVHYWRRVNAGEGPYFGLTLRRAAGGTLVGFVLGLHLWGGD